jgi:putative SOS response-associated peptidase YedK
MCNLYRMKTDVDELRKLFGSFEGDRTNLPSYDAIYPDQEAPILRRDDDGLKIETHIWGMPGFGKVKRPITNVRNLESNFWKNTLAKPEQRCLVPVTAFCEWEGEKGSKRKVWFAMKDEKPFSFAGIWRATDDGPRMAFLTTEPNEIVGAVHPKAMPVILPSDGYHTWLAGEWGEAQRLVAPYPDSEMTIAERVKPRR